MVSFLIFIVKKKKKKMTFRIYGHPLTRASKDVIYNFEMILDEHTAQIVSGPESVIADNLVLLRTEMVKIKNFSIDSNGFFTGEMWYPSHYLLKQNNKPLVRIWFKNGKIVAEIQRFSQTGRVKLFINYVKFKKVRYNEDGRIVEKQHYNPSKTVFYKYHFENGRFCYKDITHIKTNKRIVVGYYNEAPRPLWYVYHALLLKDNMESRLLYKEWYPNGKLSDFWLLLDNIRTRCVSKEYYIDGRIRKLVYYRNTLGVVFRRCVEDGVYFFPKGYYLKLTDNKIRVF
jgi:antitoxin component YwqK of YwqJK toxin-antitoxin module